MPKLTVIRHAPTHFNDEGLYIGSCDVGCSPAGLSDACDSSRVLAQRSFTRHYTSPLLRAIETSRRLFPRAQVNVHQALRERNLGDWETKRRDTIRVQFPHAFDPEGRLDSMFHPPQGEPFCVFADRVESFLLFIKALDASEHAVAVTHSGVIKVMKYLIGGRNREELISNVPFLETITFSLTCD